MHPRSVFISLVTCATLAFAASVAVRADQDGPLAPTKYKDIQVLKDVPVADFDVTMHYFGVSLGWTCQNCHVRDQATGEFNYAAEHRFKTTAREMVEMVKVVNAGDYGAKINCVTCHQGHNEPLGLPVAQMYTPEQVTAMAAQAAAQAARQGGAGARPGGAGPGGQPGAARGQQTPPPPPPFEPIIEKYIAAMGGQATLDKLQTRVTTGTMLNRSSQQVPFTIEEKGNKIRVTMTTAQGPATYAFDGKSGWQQVAGKTEDLDIFRTQQIARLNDLRRAADFSKRYTNLQAGRPTRLPSRTPGGAAINVNLVQGEIASSVVERLFFDTTSGLLLRRQVISRAPSVNGTLVETIDYSDYKDVAGVPVPFTIRLNNWNTLETYTVTDVKTGAAVDDSKFGKTKN
ncbi:MAG: photosynthetic reaction center cytochrome c subunit [Acidobacteria bacterium]|nr:photosynthetic reaction center cytochrome c subunit [Acidobacteriota bacterium]